MPSIFSMLDSIIVNSPIAIFERGQSRCSIAVSGNYETSMMVIPFGLEGSVSCPC